MTALLFGTAALAGVGIGHPNIHTGASNVVLTSAEIDVDRVLLRGCDGSHNVVEIDAVVAVGDTLELPDGCYDGMRVVANGFHAVGTGNGGTFELDLDPGTVVVGVPGAFQIGGSEAFVLELASTDWVTVELLDLDPGEHRHVDWEDPLFDALSNAIRDDSSLAW